MEEIYCYMIAIVTVILLEELLKTLEFNQVMKSF